MTSAARETLIVADTSPIIGLAKIGRLALLDRLANSVLIPRAVWSELVDRGIGRPEVAEIAARFAGAVRDPDAARIAVFGGQVDAGEAAALALAAEHAGCLLLIDDAAGRSLAEAHRLRCIGTAGLLLRARKAGMIESLERDLGALRREGIFIRAELIGKLLEAAGERPSGRPDRQ